MKKLLFDLSVTQPAFTSKRHGGGIYGEIVLKKIIELNYNVIVAYNSSLWLNPDIKALCESHDVKMADISKIGILDAIDEIKPDIFYSPQPLGDFYKSKNCDMVVTIHDLREIELQLDSKMFWRYTQGLKMQLKLWFQFFFPSYLKMRKHNRIANYVRNPEIRFVTVSNHTLSSLRLFYPELSEVDIPVYYSPSTINEVALSRKRPADYFLLVSGDRWEKNNLRAIIALDELRSAGFLMDKKVVVTGVDSVKRYRYRIKNPDMFEVVGYVEDADLHQLYHDAYCFIYPTINEGFGYPPMEAMCYGVPVLASPFSSVAEIVGDAALYFNPFSVDEIKMRILRMTDKEVYASYVDKAHERYSQIRRRQDSDLEQLVNYIYRG